jgi:hypothetical protein
MTLSLFFWNPAWTRAPPSLCDCMACTALLTALGAAVPPSWSRGEGACDCHICAALQRVTLRHLGVALPVDAAALGSLLDGGDAGGAPNHARLDAAVAALQVRAAPAPASVPVVAAAAPCAPCPAAAAAAPPQAAAPCSPAPAPAPAASAPCGRSLLGDAPRWSAALAVRGAPAPPCSVAAALRLSGEPAAQCETRALTAPFRCVIGPHRKHWEFFTALVEKTREPFALLRYVDGERMILQGTPVGSGTQAGSEDKWWYDGGETALARDMGAGLKGFYGEPVFYAVATPNDDEVGLRWYLQRMEAGCGQLTYANLWINEFYKATKPLLLRVLREQAARIVLVANHEGVDKFEPCRAAGSGAPGALLGCVSLPDQAVATWEDPVARDRVRVDFMGWVERVPDGTLFVTCGGPLSKPLIAEAWRKRKTLQLVDFGSSLDEVLKGRKTRPYMRDNEVYSRIIDPQWYCDTPNNKDAPPGSEDGNCGTLGAPDP